MRRKGNDSPLKPSALSKELLQEFFNIETSALIMLAGMLQEKSKSKLVRLTDRASCIAVIRGLRPAPPRRTRRDPEIVLGRAQYDR